MSPISDCKIRFSAARFAIESTSDTLRNWMKRGQVALGQRPESEGWRKFSYSDIAVLVIVRHLVDFGVGVEAAGRIANATVAECIGPMMHYRNSPPGALQAAFRRRVLTIWLAGDAWPWKTSIDPLPAAPSAAFAEFRLDAIIKRAFDRVAFVEDDGEAGEWIDA